MKKSLLIAFMVVFSLGFGLALISVTLNTPTDATTSQTNTEIFNCSGDAGTEKIDNISLYGTFGGSWALNETSFYYGGLAQLDYDATKYTGVAGSTSWATLKTFDLGGAYVSSLNGTASSSNAGRTGYLRAIFTYSNTSTYTTGTISVTNPATTNYNFYQHDQNKKISTIAIQVQGDGEGNGETSLNNVTGYLNSTTAQVIFTKSISSDTIWNCEVCDSTGVCNFSASNSTILLNDAPQINITAPNTTQTSVSFPLKISVFDDLANLSMCYYNITRGASIEVSNTELNISQYPLINSTITISGDAIYNLNVFCNDTIGLENSTNYTFNVDTTGLIAGGGGGGALPVAQIQDLYEKGALCVPFKEGFIVAYEESKYVEGILDKITFLWTKFWDYAICSGSSASIVPI